MVQYNVVLKPGASDEKLAEAKQKAKDNGGTIVNEFNTIKGFTVSYPDDYVNILSSDDNITVEQDAEVHTMQAGA